MNLRAVLTLASAFALSAAASAVAAGPIADLSDRERPEADRLRDADRKPNDVLAFAGIKKDALVVELVPGGGYYTRLLSQVVGEGGHVFAVSPRKSAAVDDWAAAHLNVTAVVSAPGKIDVPRPVDVVWTSNNYHDFKNVRLGGSDAAVETNRAAYQALKPGGVYLVLDHAAARGTGAAQTSLLHRIDPAFVRKEVEAAGFRFAGKSNALRNGKDDHTNAVQEKGIAGPTDQFVMKFIKPEGKQ